MNEDKNIVIKIKFTNLASVPEIEKYVRMKIQLLEKFFKHYAGEGDLLFEVEIGKTTKHHQTGNIFRAEINFTAGGVHFRSESEKDDLYSAIDEAKDELSRELRKSKNKSLNLLKRGGAALKNLLWRDTL
ncbi:MAG: ribosome-associated translation inhibitor RaiA [bacterium]|nr:ribosome-associated translation inhibitor RaiA [bacterium]